MFGLTLGRLGVVGGLKKKFSPMRLFAASEVGAWYDPSDLTTMFQDRAGTTPVTADGQTVGKILDKSGRGNHATAPSDAARPLYKTDGTYHWLQFDGVDDSLSTAAIDFTGTDKVSIWFGSLITTAGMAVYPAICGFGRINWIGTPNQFGAFNNANSGMTTFFAGNTAVNNIIMGTSLANTKFTIHSQGNLAGSTANEMNPVHTKNGVNSGIAATRPPSGSLTGVLPAGGTFGSNLLDIGRESFGAQALSGNIYSLIIRGALSTAQQITDTETWVNSKTGAY